MNEFLPKPDGRWRYHDGYIYTTDKDHGDRQKGRWRTGQATAMQYMRARQRTNSYYYTHREIVRRERVLRIGTDNNK